MKIISHYQVSSWIRTQTMGGFFVLGKHAFLIAVAKQILGKPTMPQGISSHHGREEMAAGERWLVTLRLHSRTREQ